MLSKFLQKYFVGLPLRVASVRRNINIPSQLLLVVACVLGGEVIEAGHGDYSAVDTPQCTREVALANGARHDLHTTACLRIYRAYIK